MTSMPTPDQSRRETAAIAKAAGDWLAKRDRGLTPAESAALAAWESADPRHAAELERLGSTWAALDTADELPEIQALSREVEQAIDRRARRRWPLVMVAAAALVVAAIWFRIPANERATPEIATTYQVIPSRAQQRVLADGTVVELNGDSAVEPAFAPHERRIRLIRGEAHFMVVKDATRPFIVEAGTVAFYAVGTAFNVRLDPAAVQVLVTEGKVRVEAASPAAEANPIANTPAAQPVLIAGQRLVVGAHQDAKELSELPVESVTPDERGRSLAWKSPQLVFDHTPLRDAVAAFNRFNQRQLVVTDPVLAERKLGGTFQADNAEAFVLLLESGFNVVAESRGEAETTLRGGN